MVIGLNYIYKTNKIKYVSRYFTTRKRIVLTIDNKIKNIFKKNIPTIILCYYLK